MPNAQNVDKKLNIVNLNELNMFAKNVMQKLIMLKIVIILLDVQNVVLME